MPTMFCRTCGNTFWMLFDNGICAKCVTPLTRASALLETRGRFTRLPGYRMSAPDYTSWLDLAEVAMYDIKPEADNARMMILGLRNGKYVHLKFAATDETDLLALLSKLEET